MGSSQSRTSGHLAIARAMATRCCLPLGALGREKALVIVSFSDHQSLFGAEGLTGDVGDQGHVFASRQARNQVVKLKDETHRVAPTLGAAVIVGSD